MTPTNQETAKAPTCGTCKHYLGAISKRASGCHAYNEDTWEGVQPPGYGQCGRVLLEAPDGTQAAVVADGSGYFAAIICTKDFGCNLHEERAL